MHERGDFKGVNQPLGRRWLGPQNNWLRTCINRSSRSHGESPPYLVGEPLQDVSGLIRGATKTFDFIKISVCFVIFGGGPNRLHDDDEIEIDDDESDEIE